MNVFMKLTNVFFIAILLSGCKTIDVDHTHYEGSDVLGIAFFQEASQVSVVRGNNGSIVKIKPGPFEILVPYMYPSIAVQICAFEEHKIFSQFSLKKNLQDIPCFSPGTGLAVSRENSNNRFNLYITNGFAHNYFHVSRSTNGTRYRMISVNSIIENKDASKQPVYNEFYMVVFMDKNNNKKMDKNEVEYFFFAERTVN